MHNAIRIGGKGILRPFRALGAVAFPRHRSQRPRLNRWVTALFSVMTLLVVMFAGLLTDAAAAPVYSAIAGPGNSDVVGSCIVNSAGGQFMSTPQAANIVCGDAHGTNAGAAASSIGHVGASANTASFDGQISNNNGHATYSDSVIFSGPAGSLLTSMNVLFAGILNEANGGLAQVGMFVAIDGTIVGSVSNVTNSPCVSTFSSNLGCGGTTLGGLTTGSILVQANVPVTFLFDLAVGVGSDFPGASARADFSNSLDLPIGTDVFNLPAGYTVNSEGSSIASNRFVPPTAVPLPETCTLLLTGLGLIGSAARRRKQKTA